MKNILLHFFLFIQFAAHAQVVGTPYIIIPFPHPTSNGTAIVSAYNCSTASAGTMTVGMAVSGVSQTISAIVSMVGTYNISAISNGVTFVASGTFTNTGSQNIVLNASGNPTAAGCSNLIFTLNTSPNCSFIRILTTMVVDVTNPATGKIWMDRNLGASVVATASTTAAAYGDLYQWGRLTDGHQCRTSATTSTLSSSDVPGNGNYITTSDADWRSPSNPNLWQGLNAINNPCPSGYRLPTEAEWTAERTTWSSSNAAGAIGSPLKLPGAGGRRFNDGGLFDVGTFGYYSSSDVSGSISSRFLLFNSSTAGINTNSRSWAYSVRCIKGDISSGGTAVVSSYTCSTASSGTMVASDAVSGVTQTITATVTTVGTYNISAIANGVTFNATGTFAGTGLQNILLTALGTPAATGSHTFTLNTTPSCSFSRVTSGIVTNSITGKIWLDRNLGARQIATSSTDALSYGDLYQWGRLTDGHQVSTSITTNTLSTNDVPSNANFILAPNTPFDWRSSLNITLWQGINGTNNPCPIGYRIPTLAEWLAERNTWSSLNSIGAFASSLKLPMAGYRLGGNGGISATNSLGVYWSADVSTNQSERLAFNTSAAINGPGNRSDGTSIRCIKGDVTSGGTAVVSTYTCSTASAGTLTTGSIVSGVTQTITATVATVGTYNISAFANDVTFKATGTFTGTGAQNIVLAASGTPTSIGNNTFTLNTTPNCAFTRTTN